ncbi:hypothetical protein [Maridesulfovibrio bastinii]|uniref:VgrG-related protein n=1 Tax=Maridesulfovibrio bastinii TaxID=47157 RepID=UPI00040F478B|nr:hypothetical protein [Maridesulfovibrio bastinii]
MSNYLSALTKIVGNSGIDGSGGISSGFSDLIGKNNLKSGDKSFESEMLLAQKMFNDSSDSSGQMNVGGMDTSIMNDALVLEALQALSSVKGLNLSRQIKAYGTDFSALNPQTSAGLKKTLANQPVSNPIDSSEKLGGLTAHFESGSQGVGAIGYDRVGGTSYGKYQIASKTGAMDDFMDFLKTKAPDLAKRLGASGPSNTGSTGGGMPEEWKKISSEDPAGFEALQHDFIKASHYDPAAKIIFEKTGIDINKMPEAVKEVIWSTSVQHGATGAGRMIADAVESLAESARSQGFPSNLVKEIYGERKSRFGSSTEAVRNSVQARLDKEENLILSMLKDNPLSKMV